MVNYLIKKSLHPLSGFYKGNIEDLINAIENRRFNQASAMLAQTERELRLIWSIIE